jgi:2-phospho-L-lactate guanylyltransferase (CobY/MobA/RfbA family)
VRPSFVIPFRRDRPKTRLPDIYRQRLAEAMLADVVAACAEVGDPVVVDEPGGLGPAVAAALRPLAGRPVAVVNADLPAVTPDDLQALLRSLPRRGLALVPARDGTVNALAFSHAELFRPLYGPGSAARFAASAPSRVARIPNLVDDVDVAEDAERILPRAGSATRRALLVVAGSRASDVDARGHGRSKVGSSWTHDLVAYALERFHSRHLRTPTLQELRAGLEDVPSYSTIKRMYGSAGTMLAFHGYRVRAPGGQRGRRCTLDRDAAGLFLPRRPVS